MQNIYYGNLTWVHLNAHYNELSDRAGRYRSIWRYRDHGNYLCLLFIRFIAIQPKLDDVNRIGKVYCYDWWLTTHDRKFESVSIQSIRWKLGSLVFFRWNIVNLNRLFSTWINSSHSFHYSFDDMNMNHSFCPKYRRLISERSHKNWISSFLPGIDMIGRRNWELAVHLNIWSNWKSSEDGRILHFSCI